MPSSRPLRAALAALTVLACLSVPAHAAMVSYQLDQTSQPSVLPNGTPYVKVTIDDQGTPGNINFHVQTLAPLNILAGPSGFGLDLFGFNSVSGNLTAANFSGLPSGWVFDNTGNSNVDGFGRFAFRVDTNGAGNRVASLNFSIINVTGDTVMTYVALSTNNATGGNQFFVAQAAGLVIPNSTLTSGFFAGTTPTPIPLPAALWLFASGLGFMPFVRRRDRTA
jgi:hypothetical protein